MLLASNAGAVNLLPHLKWGKTINDIPCNEVNHIALIGHDINRYDWLIVCIIPHIQLSSPSKKILIWVFYLTISVFLSIIYGKMDSFLFFLNPEYNRFAIITHSRNFAYFTLGWLFCLTDVQPKCSRTPPLSPLALQFLICKYERLLRENVSIHRTNLKYCGKSPKVRFHSYFHIFVVQFVLIILV